MTTIAESVVSFIPTTTEDVLTAEVFRNPLLLHINAALATLCQNGVGRTVDLFSNPDMTWEEFFGELDECVDTSIAKQYVYIRTQLLFDPPQPSAIQVLEKVADETLWRARLEFEEYGQRIAALRSVGDEMGDSEVEEEQLRLVAETQEDAGRESREGIEEGSSQAPTSSKEEEEPTRH